MGADREEKRVTRGTVREKVQEHLDLSDPNQRRLLVLLSHKTRCFGGLMAQYIVV